MVDEKTYSLFGKSVTVIQSRSSQNLIIINSARKGSQNELTTTKFPKIQRHVSDCCVVSVDSAFANLGRHSTDCVHHECSIDDSFMLRDAELDAVITLSEKIESRYRATSQLRVNRCPHTTARWLAIKARSCIRLFRLSSKLHHHSKFAVELTPLMFLDLHPKIFPNFRFSQISRTGAVETGKGPEKLS